MAVFNYSQAKLLTFFSTQYISTDNTSYVLTDSNLSTMLNAGANGYVLIPRSGNGNNYNITDLETGNNYCNFSNPMVDFAERIKGMKSDACFWIGLPQITDNLFKYCTNDTQVNEKVNLYSRIMLAYIWDIHWHFTNNNHNLWDNVKGFYYNQERFYDNNFNPDSMNSYGEYKLMQNVSNCIHNNDFSIYPEKQVPTNRDLIWIPYIHAYSLTGEPNISEPANTIMAKEIKYIGKVAGTTNTFDCVFIQSNLTPVYGLLSNPYNYPNVLSSEEEITANRVNSGITNIRTIAKSVRDNKMYYRFGEGTSNPVPVTTPTSNCVLGAEYELNGDVEFHNNSSIYNQESVSLFRNYTKYDQFSGVKPLAFYWQTTSTSYFTDVCNRISDAFKYATTNPKFTAITTTATSILSAVSSTFSSAITAINSSTSQPAAATVNVNYNNTLPSYRADAVAKATKAMFFADNPEKFWVNDLNYSFTYNSSGDYVNKITYNVTTKSGSISSYVNTFNSKVNSILSGLGISVVNTSSNELTLMSVDDEDIFETFHKIFNWVVTKVRLTTSTNAYYNSPYIAIIRNDGSRYATIKGFAEALAVLCKAAGIPCIVANGYKNDTAHYWNYVKIGDDWWFVDSALSIPTTSDPYKYKYFLRTTPSSYHISPNLPEINETNGSYVKYGDVTGDGEVSSNDSAYVQQKVILPSFNLGVRGDIAADVTGDGNITSDDASEIFQKVLVSTYELPVERKIREDYI